MADQDQAKQNADAQRADAQRRAAAEEAQRRNQPQPQSGSESAAAATEKARQANREQVAREREERANRPQDVGGKPTPTQEENDEIRAGVRHIDDKEDDGSGPDHAQRIDEARRTLARNDEESRRRAMSAEKNLDGQYKTR